MQERFIRSELQRKMFNYKVGLSMMRSWLFTCKITAWLITKFPSEILKDSHAHTQINEEKEEGRRSAA